MARKEVVVFLSAGKNPVSAVKGAPAIFRSIIDLFQLFLCLPSQGGIGKKSVRVTCLD